MLFNIYFEYKFNFSYQFSTKDLVSMSTRYIEVIVYDTTSEN